MTLPELATSPRKTCNKTMAIGTALKELLIQAKLDGRVTCGVFECASLLEISPDNIMLCLLPKDTNNNDVTAHIQQTLIEAFCWENDIRLLMVENTEGLESSLSHTSLEHTSNDINKNRIQPFTNDFSCVLIENPESTYSAADQSLFYHYNKISCTDGFPTPPVKIPTD